MGDFYLISEYFDNVRLSDPPPPTPLLVKGLCPFTSTRRSAAAKTLQRRALEREEKEF